MKSILRNPERLFTHAFVVIAFAVLNPAMPRASAGDERSLVQEWLDQSSAYFEEHEEHQRTGSWAWRSFVRTRRFLDARTIGGVLPSAADQMRAWEAARARRTSSGNTWTSIGPPNISGRIVDLKFHPTNPKRVYAAAASGGLWISSDGGDTWRTTTDELPSLAIGAVCVLPTDPDVVLVATGEGYNWKYVVFGVGIWKSMDGGETWNPTSLTYEITDNHGFHVMEANPITGTILAGANDGLWRSTDEGDTWTLVRNGGDYHDVKWKPGSANRVYTTKGDAPSGNGLLVSNDDGLSWTFTGSGLPPSSSITKMKLAVTPTEPSVIYAHIGSTGIYRSMDDGSTFSARNTTLNISGGQGPYTATIAVDPVDTQHVIAGGIKLYLSMDGGLTFAETGAGNPLGDETSVHVDHHAIAWEPGSTSNLWDGNDGGLWRSTDSGATWHQRRDGLVTTQFYDVCLDPNAPGFTMGGSQDNGLPWVEETGEPWFPSTLTADGLACHVEPLVPDTIYSEWQFGGHIKSVDRAQSWYPTMNGISGNATAFAPLDLDPNRTGHLYTATMDGVFRTLNGQNFWTHVALHSPIWISISPVDGDIIWTAGALTGGAPVRYTTNDGSSWTYAQHYFFLTGNETKILAHPKDPATAFVTFACYSVGAHVARTRDFGQSWEDVSGDFPPDPANTMAIDPRHPKHWFVGTDTGVWHSENGGVNWTPFGLGLPNVVVYDLEIHRKARKLVACTYGRGIWSIDLEPFKDSMKGKKITLPPIPPR
jgi:photosystem II stability/assembly factor-like uncharacterized protein